MDELQSVSPPPKLPPGPTEGESGSKDSFLYYCSHQYWMGSNDILSSHFTVLLLSLNHGIIKIREKISEKILEMPGIEPRAAEREANMLFTVLCGPP